MYITINDVKGEKTIDLSYPIHSKKEIAVVSMHIINSQILLHRSIEVLSVTGKKIVLNKGVYTDKDLNSLIGMELKSQMPDSHNDIQRTNKLVNGTKINISLNELNNWALLKRATTPITPNHPQSSPTTQNIVTTTPIIPNHPKYCHNHPQSPKTSSQPPAITQKMTISA